MKLLIVDDEDYTREGLIEGVKWKEEFGIREIMQARDGKAGLNLARWFRPDIVLSDVKMPRLNGISFAKELEIINPDVKIIFISGYMEIDYLKSAISLSAIDYLEKPIDLTILKRAVRKAAEEIRQKQLTHMITADRKELQQQILANALVCKDNDKDMLYNLCREIEFPLNQNYICLILWNKENTSNSELLQKEIQDYFNTGKVKALCSYLGEGKYFAVIAYQKKYSSHLTGLYHKILLSFPALILGVGFEVLDIMNVYNSYQTAFMAINCAFYDEKERIFTVDEEILQPKGVEPGIYGEFYRILTEDFFRLRSWCEAFFEDLRRKKYYRKENIQILLTSFVTAMVDQHPKLLDSIEGAYSKEAIGQIMSQFFTLTQIHTFMMDLIRRLEEKQMDQSVYSRVVRGVIDYIDRHYSESDLSIPQMAEAFHFSANYLSALFKHETHVTLKQYLSEYRIKKAKKMLEEDYYKISEIASLCGYANSNYFIKVFKEVTDLTPLEYRKKKTE